MTLEELAQRLEEQDAMIALLQEQVETLLAAAPGVPEVHLYREVSAPPPISQPIDFQMMAVELGLSQAYADPYEEWGPGSYL